MARSVPYPDWICEICGVKYGRWYSSGHYTGPEVHCATYHVGQCGVCDEKHTMVTEPRDFGYFLDWGAVENKIRGNKKSRKTQDNC